MNQLITPAFSRVLCFLIPVVVFGSIINDLSTIPPANPINYSVSQGNLK